MAPEYTVTMERPEPGANQIVSSSDTAILEAEAVALRRNSFHEYRLEQIQNLLRAALDSKHAIELDAFKRTDPYLEPEPPPPRYLEYPPEPQADDAQSPSASGQAVTSATPEAELKKQEAHKTHVREYNAWAETVKTIENENQRRYAESVAAVERWNGACQKHRQAQAAYNEAIDRRKADYQALQPAAIEDYCRQVLSASIFPEDLPRVFDVQYLPDTKTLIIEHSLPSPQNLPRVKGVKHIKGRSELVEVPLSARASNRLYANVLHQICLRTLHELFDADTAGGLSEIAFNGWMESADPATGGKSRSYLLSVKAGKEQFRALNLWDTDAKACFKALKGVADSKLHTLTPVVPVLKINRQEIGPQPLLTTAQTWTQTDPPAAK